MDQVIANPFPVYPVSSLGDLTDIRAATVLTTEVEAVRGAVESYIDGFRESPINPSHHLVLVAKGDFGSGKTHLMRFARDELEYRARELGRGAVGLPVTANEAAIEDWYQATLGPALVAVRPRDLVRDLMTEVACEVALESRFTQHLAEKFRASPSTMFDALRDAEEIDASEVERRFEDVLRQLSPPADFGFHRVLCALPWTGTALLAERWLAGDTLTDGEREQIGAPASRDGSSVAMAALCAVAGASRVLRRPFALFIDELEHLVRHDRRIQSRRNITWLKRLVEALVGKGAMVFVSGHWEAWEQQGDFLDRFLGHAPIQLVRLTEADVIKVVQVCAPGWVPNFSPLTARAVIDATSGNIRRVMTVLYDLFSEESNRTSPVSTAAVHAAALRRLERNTPGRILPAIEAAACQQGATVTANTHIGDVSVDAAVQVENDLRLVVKIVHGRDEGTLLAEGERFADNVRKIRLTRPRVRGLFVALGAVNPQHLTTLDIARSEMDVLNAEASDAEAQLTRFTLAALDTPSPQPERSATAAGNAPKAELSALRQGINAEALRQTVRADQQLSTNARDQSLRNTVAADSIEVLQQKQDIDQRAAVDKFLTRERSGAAMAYLDFLLARPIGSVMFFFGLMLLLFAHELGNLFLIVISPLSLEERVMYSATVEATAKVCGALLIMAGLIVELRAFTNWLRFREYRSRVMEDEAGRSVSLRDLIALRNVFDRSLREYGSLEAQEKVEVYLAEQERKTSSSSP